MKILYLGVNDQVIHFLFYFANFDIQNGNVIIKLCMGARLTIISNDFYTASIISRLFTLRFVLFSLLKRRVENVK